MDYKVWTYLLYLAISVGLTVWVASTLSRNGLVFLEEVFGDGRLARAVNHLLVVGFYLVNLGYVTVAMRTGGTIESAAGVLESLSRKVGAVLLVLGALHLLNVFALSRYRRSRQRRRETQPPVPPTGHHVPVAPVPPGPPAHAGQAGPPAHPGQPGPPAYPGQPGPPPYPGQPGPPPHPRQPGPGQPEGPGQPAPPLTPPGFAAA